MEDIIVSSFANARSTQPVDVKLSSVLEAIRKGKWKDQIEKLRAMSDIEYKEAKTNLPAVTFCGTFSERKKDALIKYSHIVILDIDNIDADRIFALKLDLMKDEYCFACFTSPSGRGLKVLYKVLPGAGYHLANFLHLQKYFQDKYLVAVDESGKDTSRLCFVSYDEECLYNPECTPFDVDIRYGEVKTYSRPEKYANHSVEKNWTNVFELCRKWVEGPPTPIHYVQGSRNRYVHALACALNRTGVPMDNSLQLMISTFTDLEEKEISRACRNGYFQNQQEFGTVQVKDISIGEYKAPPYVLNYTEDVVEQDLMATTSMLYYKGIDTKEIGRIVSLIARYYEAKGFIDIDRATLADLMNRAITQLSDNIASEASEKALKYESIEEMAARIMKSKDVDGLIQTFLQQVDEALGGGLIKGSVYGIIGLGGTFKSFLLLYICYANAANGEPCLYLNGEMSSMQTYSRLFSMVYGKSLRYEMSRGRITEENMPEIIKGIEEYFKGNLIVVNGQGYTKENIEATLDLYYARTGKKIKLIAVDGLSQFDAGGRDEASAAIYNSGVCKEIAKDAYGGEGVIVMPLIHTSGDQNFLLRDTGLRARGGSKIRANLDGYFSTSLLMDPETNNLENDGDTMYLPGKFYLRLVDKRTEAGVSNFIVNMDGRTLKLNVEDCNPLDYEIKRK